MRPRLRLVGPVAAGLAAAVLASALGVHVLLEAAQAPPQVAPAAIQVDVVVLGRDGKLADNLGPADFAISVDNQPRRLLWVRRVSRGPGAVGEATSRQARGDGSVRFAAEPSRTVIVAIDQATIPRGEERTAIRAAGAFLDRLGIDDRVAVVRIPMSADALVSPTTDRPEAREALGLVVGQAAAATALAADLLAAQQDPERRGGVDPDREKTGDPDRTADPTRLELAAPDPTIRPEDADPAARRDPFTAFLGLLQSLQKVPGRKAVALFSAGFPGISTSQAREAAAIAAAARVAIHAFGLRTLWSDPRTAPSTAPLETMATSSGGAFMMLGRNPESAVERVASHLSACYVLGVESAPSDTDGRRHLLRVATTRRELTAHAASWLRPAPDVEDLAPPAPEAAAEPAAPGPVERASPLTTGSPARELELQMALARLADYVAGYERHYSGLVAEEDFRQTIQRRTVRVRSDLLLVKPENTDRWVSFRDVYEVDGRAVRDREERLKRLFLDPAPEAVARLQAIKDESARHNIGPILRNINVPLFPLAFLSTDNRPRFAFKLVQAGSSEGVEVWRIEYVERARPTIITDLNGGDVPTSGWFLVDQGTGAIVESGLRLAERGFTASMVVNYRRDPALGMWVPARMREDYRLAGPLGAPAPPEFWGATSMEGQAEYSKFRRFQVKTEITVTIPK